MQKVLVLPVLGKPFYYFKTIPHVMFSRLVDYQFYLDKTIGFKQHFVETIQH